MPTIALTVQCGRALASIGGWAQIWEVLSNAEGHHPPRLFTPIVHLCFGRIEFLAAMGTPPTRPWCAHFVERCVQGRTVTKSDVGMIMANLTQWDNGAVDLAVKLGALQALPDQWLFAKANVRLLLGTYDILIWSAVDLIGPLKAFFDRVHNAVNRTCPWYIASPLEHRESHCVRCLALFD